MDKLSTRDCEGLLFAREICCPIVTNISGHMVARDVEFFFLLLEMRDLNKFKSKLEIVMEKRMLDTCQHNYVV